MKIVPACDVVRATGAKIILYGTIGSGKTPMCANIPDALLVATEPGFLSIRKLQTPSVQCYDVQSIEDFFKWFKSDTTEKNKFNTICVDSVSEMCSIYIRKLESIPTKGGNQADGKKVYGDMARAVLRELNYLYYVSKFNVILTAKRGEIDFEHAVKYRPYFPGKQLNIEVPHLFDCILHLDKVLGKWEFHDNVPTLVADTPGKYAQAIFARETNTFTARDRSGTLNEVEYPDLSYILYKINNF